MTPSASRLLVLAFALGPAPSAAVAQAGPNSLSITCQSARQLVLSRGAAVISTGRYDYDRYVSSNLFCMRGETTEPAWIPTSDNPQCFVGYRCREIDLDVYGR